MKLHLLKTKLKSTVQLKLMRVALVLSIFLAFSSTILFAQPVLNCSTCASSTFNACTGDLLQDYMDIIGESGGSTYVVTGDILNPGTQNSFAGFVLNDIAPLGTGTVNILVNSANGVLNQSLTVNFANVQAAFNYTQSNTPDCYSIALDNNSSISSNFGIDAYNWDFDFPGGTSAIANPTIPFPQPGTYQVTLTVTDVTYQCVDSYTSTITVTGPQPFLTFEGNGFSLDVSDFGDTCIVPFCVGGSNVAYDLNIQNNAGNNSGAANTQFDFVDLQNATTQVLPYNVSYAPNQTGFAYFQYTVTDANGCEAEKVYAVYRSDLQNLQFTCTQQGTANYCVGEEITFDNNNWTLNPADATYQVQFICEATGEVIYENTWIDAPPNEFTFTPEISSCGCNQDNSFLIKSYSSSPCDPPGLPYTAYFSAGFPADAEFSTTSPSPACLSESLSFDWLYDNGNISNQPGPCKPQFNWTITQLSTNTDIPPASGDNTAHMDHAFSAPGQYEVKLAVSSGCGSDIFKDTVCVYPQINETTLGLNFVWGIPANACAPAILHPVINGVNDLICGIPDYTWRLYQMPSLTLLNSYTTVNPNIPVPSKGHYKLQLMVQVDNCGTVFFEQEFYVGSAPVINISGPVYNACSSGNSICLDQLFCIDTCYKSLTTFSIKVFSGSVNCSNPTGVPVYTSLDLPHNNLLMPCSVSGCQYDWLLPNNPAATYSLVITATNACGSATQCVTINIGSPTVANIPQQVCSQSTIDLAAISPQLSCTWQQWNGSAWQNISGSIIINGDTPILLSCPGECPLQDTIHVFPPFTLNPTSFPATVCGGLHAELTIAVTPNSTVIDQFEINGNVQPGSDNTFTTPMLNTNTDYTIVATDENGCEVSSILTVPVEAAPVLVCSGSSYCESDTAAIIDFTSFLTLNGIYPTNATWKINGQLIQGNHISVGQVISQFGSPSGSNMTLVLQYNLISNAGCFYSEDCDVVIEYQGVINEAPMIICAGDLLEITATTSGQWNTSVLPSGVPSTPDGSYFAWTPLISDTGNYTIAFNSGCSLTNYPIVVKGFDLILSADDFIVCAGNEVNLSAQVFPLNTVIQNYQWVDNSGVILSGNQNTLSAMISSNNTFTVNAENADGCLATDQLEIDVEMMPAMNCSSILQSYCESSTDNIDLSALLVFNGNYPLSAEWSVCGNTIGTLNLAISEIVASCGPVVSDSEYYISYELNTANNCNYSDSCSVFIENEDLEIIEENICTGNTLSIAGDGNWETSNLPPSAPPSGNYVDFVWNIPVNESEGNYVLSFSAGCGITEYHIHIHSTPIPSVSLSSSVLCIENQITVNAQPFAAQNFGYTYENLNGTMDLGSSVTTFSPSELGITQTDPGNLCLWAENVFDLQNNATLTCADTACAEIDIIDVPGLPDAADAICYEEPFSLSGSFDSFELTVQGDSYISNPIVLYGLTGVQNYDLNIAYGGLNACSLDTTGIITIEEPIVYSITMIGDSCTGEAVVNINIEQGENLNFELISEATISGASGLHEGSNLLQFDTAVADDTVYPVTINIDNGGCNSETWTDEILVYAAPQLFMDVSSSSALCAGEEVCLDVINLGSSSIQAVSFDMGNDTVFNFTPDNIQTPCTHYNAVLNQVTYTVIGTITGQCAIDTAYLDITIQPQNVLVVMGEYPDGFCPGDTVDLTPSSINGSGPFNIAYSFFPNFSPYFTDDQHIIIPSGISDQELHITINVDGECGADEDIATVYIKPTPMTDCANSPTCQNVEVDFSNLSDPLEGEFYWHIVNDDTVYHALNFQYVFPDNSHYEVVLIQNIEGQCPGTDTLELDVHARPHPEIIMDSNCYIESYEQVRVYTDYNYANYTWSIENELFNTSDASITFVPEDVSSGDTLLHVDLNIIDQNGCSGNTSMEVHQCEAPIVYVPNCFTPDKDGINDVFCVSTINIINFEMWIFDRWGHAVFHTTNPDQCWTGEDNDGEYFVKDGVYEWKIIYNKRPGSKDKLFKRDEESWQYPPLMGHVIILR